MTRSRSAITCCTIDPDNLIKIFHKYPHLPADCFVVLAFELPPGRPRGADLHRHRCAPVSSGADISRLDSGAERGFEVDRPAPQAKDLYLDSRIRDLFFER